MQQYSFVTVEGIIDAAIAEAVGSTISSLTALQDTQLIERVEALNAEFIRMAHTRHPIGGWSWMRKNTVFKTYANTTLNGAISAGAATLILTSGTNFDSAGRIVIETSGNALDFVDYESKSTHTLTVSTTTGAETVSVAHTDGSRVEKMYALPSDYGKTRRMYVNSTEYTYAPLDWYPRIGNYSTYGAYFLMPRGLGANDVTLYYEKKSATITATSDATDIPTVFQRWAIEKLKAHIFAIRKKRADIALCLQLAEQELASALDFDAQEVSNSELTAIPLPY